MASIATDEDYVKALLALFRRRGHDNEATRHAQKLYTLPRVQRKILRMKLSRHISLIMLSLLTFMSGMAAPVSVKARLDSVQILMGKLTVLHLEAVQRKGGEGRFSYVLPGSTGRICRRMRRQCGTPHFDKARYHRPWVRDDTDQPLRSCTGIRFRNLSPASVRLCQRARHCKEQLSGIEGNSCPGRRRCTDFRLCLPRQSWKDSSLIFFPTGSLTCGGFGCPSFCLPFCS